MKNKNSFLRRNAAGILIVLLLFSFLVVYFANRIFIIIHSGEAGVIYRVFQGGTVTDQVYGEGLHIVFPWNTMFIYNIRIQEEKRSLDVLTDQGLKIGLNLSIRYHPEADVIGVLHKEVGPDYVEKIVVPEVESAIRTNVGTMTAEELYMTQGNVLEKIVNEALRQTQQRYVQIDDVIIRQINLPPTLTKAIEDKQVQEQIAAAYEYRLKREKDEATRKEIEADGFKRYNEIIAASLTPEILKWKGIEATRELAASPNTKIVVVGNGTNGLPLILGSDK